MKRAKRWLLVAATTALFVLLELQSTQAALPFKKVSIATSTPSTSTTTSASASDASAVENAAESAPEESSATETKENKAENTSSYTTKSSKLTGIPQIDYIWDPNLPRELRGYNLSSYPFLSTVPPEEDIHFKCEGLHDGFYASIEHKCQVYHHCVYGIRHDFLCANFTAFDQKTFICHFVSDVDCEGSQRYWNRNDELYMATTTTSTTTTTTEPPPTQRSRRPARPQRPLRRPYNRRPIDDYYYDEDGEDDDYYVERYNRRRKQRPKQRKPIADYEDDYDDDKRGFDEDDEVEKPRRNNRFHDDDDQLDDYDSDRRGSRPKGRQGKPTATVDKRKTTSGRKPGRADERRSFNDDRSPASRREKVKPNTFDDSSVESVIDNGPRRFAGRRRINEKRTTPSTAAALDDLDDYERPHAADQEEAAEEEAPQKVKTTVKPLEEFITPKAAPSSVFSRPRAPPRIARPVPINEKKKYQYPVQKATATTPTPQGVESGDDDDYYLQQQDDDYEDTRGRNTARRRTVGVEDEPDTPIRRRNNNNDAANNSRKPTRGTLRKPVTDKKALVEDDDYDNSRIETSRGTASRRRPLASRPRPSTRVGDDVDFVDDDYDDRPQIRPATGTGRGRTKPTTRKSVSRTREPIEDVEVEDSDEPERPQRGRISQQVSQVRRNKPALPVRSRTSLTRTTPAAVDLTQEEEEPEKAAESEAEQEDDAIVPAAPSKSFSRPASVRVVKRPFLPSRGGSPYLPRGLQPVGVALRPLLDTRTTDSTPIDMGSTISGVRLLEHGAPILRNEGNDDDEQSNERITSPIITSIQGPRTTLPPRSPIPVSTQIRSEPQPKTNLDELYENDYDVTLNDALDPTLKPLTPQHQHLNRNYASAYAPASSSNAASLHPFAHSNQSPAQPHYQQQHLQAQHQAYQPQNHNFQSPSTASAASQPPQQQNYNSDSYFSSTDIRRRAIVPAQISRSSRTDYRGFSGIGGRIAQHFYDDFEY